MIKHIAAIKNNSIYNYLYRTVCVCVCIYIYIYYICWYVLPIVAEEKNLKRYHQNISSGYL